MPSREPLVRASHVRDSMEALPLLGPGVAGAVIARLSASAQELIQGAGRTGWLPLAVNVELVEAVYAAGGAVVTRRFGRELLQLGVKGFFRPLFQAVRAIFEPSPAAICRFAPRAWLSTYRECGTMEIRDVGEDRLRVALVDFPEPLRRTPYATAFAGTLEATYEFSAREGKVEIEGPEGRALGYLLTWTPRAPGAGSPGSHA